MRSKSSFPGTRVKVAAVLLALSCSGALAATPAQTVLSDSIKPVTATSASGPVDTHKPYISRATLHASESSAMMPFEVVLKMRNLAELQARVAQGDTASPSEMAAKYDPLPTDYQAVIDWLTGHGFTITRRDAHHMAIFARGTVSQIQQVMQVRFARVTSEGKEYTSAVSAPNVPASVASLLVGINGLQPHLRAHKHIVQPNATSGTASYTPSQIAQAYQASSLYSSNITGTGQTIAIIIDTFPATSDLLSFWQTNSISQSLSNIQFIQAVSGALPSISGEETLDVEWSSAIAPGAKIRVYATTDLGNTDLDTGYQQVYEDVLNHPEYGIHQMSMSYGEGETYTTNSQVQTDDQYFAELANAGVTCFASSGDNGPTPDANNNDSGPVQAETPASDPNVTSVGGTSLQLNSNNTVSSETVWNDRTGASGGGASIYFSRPSWQTGTGVASGTMRLVPDIACAADPNYGADVFLEGKAQVYGGTSWATPTCAGFCALINEARANNGLASVGLLGPQIYPLIGTTNFRDITSGNNITPASGGLYTATTGYDECTGIGVPLVQPLAETFNNSKPLLGVSQQPPAQSVVPGQNATFTVTAGGSPVSYQWQRMPVGTSTWNNLSDNGTYTGSATSALKVTNATQAMSGDQFQCVVTYADATLTSFPSSVLVVETPLLITTLAGKVETAGLVNSTGTGAEFNYPSGLAIDSSGNLFIADYSNNVIRKVTPGGVVTTPYGSLSGVSGTTNSTGNNALFNSPNAVVIDSSNNLYVADTGNNLVRKITASTGAVSTLGASATFNGPEGIAVDGSGNVYVADTGNNIIRKIATNGTVTTLAGQSGVAGYEDGAGTTQALFNEPLGLAVDGSGNVYVADFGNAVVRMITPSGVVSTVAGQADIAGYLDGLAGQALFNAPTAVAVDSSGNLYVTDSQIPPTTSTAAGNNLLRKISPAGVVSTLAGQAGVTGSANGTGSAAEFYSLQSVALGSTGTFYLADTYNQTIRSGTVETTVFLSATEPNASVLGPVAGQFTVTRTGSTAASLTVNYSISGTAISGTDYTALPGSVTIPAGENSATITVNPLSDSQATTNRTVLLTLTTSTSGVVLDANPATVTILESQLTTFSQWEAAYSISSPATATPFDDGVPNLLKYLYDINPAVTMTAADRAALPVFDVADGNLTLTYRQYWLETGITVHVQTSPDLQTWTTVSNPTQIQTGTGPNGHDPILQIQVPFTQTPEFIRLNVTQP